MILNCPHCRAKVGPRDEKCPSCNRRMVRHCPACAETISIKSQVCKYCGEEAGPAKIVPSRDVEFIEEQTGPCAWESTRKGVVRRWWGTWKDVSFHPRRFFQSMPKTGGHRWPVGYAYGLIAQILFVIVFGLALAGVLAAWKAPTPCGDYRNCQVTVWGLAGMAILAIPLTFIPLTFLLYVRSFLWHVFLKLLGSQERFQSTLRVVAYSSGALLWNVIPGLGFLMQSIAFYHGFRQTHGLSRAKSIFAVLLPAIVMIGAAAAWILCFLTRQTCVAC